MPIHGGCYLDIFLRLNNIESAGVMPGMNICSNFKKKVMSTTTLDVFSPLRLWYDRVDQQMPVTDMLLC